MDHGHQIIDVLNYIPPESSPHCECQIMGMPQFVFQYREEAEKAHRRTWLETMYAMPSHLTDALVDTLSKSAQRGLDSRLYTDGIQNPLCQRDTLFSLMFGKNSERDYQHRATISMENKMAKSHVKHLESRPYRPINYVLFSLLRNHLKLGIVDDIVWIGGLNAGKDADYNRIDYMVRFDSPPLAEMITGIIENQNSLKKDITDTCGNLDVLVDRGHPGESVIYDSVIHRLHQINNPANSQVTIMSPWVPDGQMLEELDKLQKSGANITVITSYHKFELALEGVYALVKDFNMLKMRLKGKKINILYSPVEIHGKMLSICDGDNEYAMITTHNLVTQGIAMGTTEIAIGSSCPDFTQNCQDYLNGVQKICSPTPNFN